MVAILFVAMETGGPTEKSSNYFLLSKTNCTQWHKNKFSSYTQKKKTYVDVVSPLNVKQLSKLAKFVIYNIASFFVNVFHVLLLCQIMYEL